MEFDASQRDDVVELLAKCIVQLPPTQKTVLALYYHENWQLAEIAACVGMTECEIDQIRAETVALLRTMLAAQIGLAELPVGFDNVAEHGSGVLVNVQDSPLASAATTPSRAPFSDINAPPELPGRTGAVI